MICFVLVMRTLLLIEYIPLQQGLRPLLILTFNITHTH